MGLLNRLQGVASASDSGPLSGADPHSHHAYSFEGDEFFDVTEAVLHEHAHQYGGLGCADDKLREQQQQAINEWIQRLGKRLLSGNGLASTPAPVTIFEPRSHLQKLTDTWQYTQYLRKAAIATSKLDRLKFVVAWFVSGCRHTFDTWRKPFNPVLGETWQGKTASGCRCYLEQVSHHPPIAAFKFAGPGYKMSGTAEASISVVIKHRGFKQQTKGPRTITFADGDVVEFLEMPWFVTKGVVGSNDLRGDISGQAILTLRSEGASSLTAQLTFGPIQDAAAHLYRRVDAFQGYVAQTGGTPRKSASRSSSLQVESVNASEANSTSGPRSGQHLARRSHKSSGAADKGAGSGLMLPSVTQVSSWLRNAHSSDAVPHSAMARIYGNWLSHMDMETGTGSAGHERVWTLQECNADAFDSVDQVVRLPSDCTFRRDMQLLASGDIEGAEAEKQRIEDCQRRYRKLRKS